MHRIFLIALVLLPAAVTSCRDTRGRPGESNHPPTAPAVVLPKSAKSLEVLGAVSYVLDKTVSAVFTGTEPSGKPTPSFDSVGFHDLMHAVPQSKTTFTLNSKPAQPKPAIITVSYSVDGSSKPGATITATAGRFITGVTATIDDYAGFEIKVQAVQDDGSRPDISYP